MIAVPLKFATSTAARQAVRAAPKRLGPHPVFMEMRRVAPTIGQWGLLMFGFLSWPTAAVYTFQKTTGV